jgi:DNA-binding NarL/FixJ family response regulator
MTMATPSLETIPVAIVEDDDRTRNGLAALIQGTPGFGVVGRYRTMEDAVRRVELDRPRIVLADIGLPGMSGVEGVARLKARIPELLVVMLTVYADNEHVFEAICNGACGYLLKDTPPSRLVEALREVDHGGAPMSPEIARKVLTMFHRVAPLPEGDTALTPRELQVLKLLAEGHSYKSAAAELDLSIETIRFHVMHVYRKLHVHSKSEAVALALRRGLVR